MSGAPANSPDAGAGAAGRDAVLGALADPHRRRVLSLAGLLSRRRDGARRLYVLRPEALEPARAVLAELWPDALERLKRAVEQDKRGSR